MPEDSGKARRPPDGSLADLLDGMPEELKPARRMVLLAVVSYCAAGCCRASTDSIAARAGVDKRTAQRALDELEEAGLLVVLERPSHAPASWSVGASESRPSESLLGASGSRPSGRQEAAPRGVRKPPYPNGEGRQEAAQITTTTPIGVGKSSIEPPKAGSPNRPERPARARRAHERPQPREAPAPEAAPARGLDPDELLDASVDAPPLIGDVCVKAYLAACRTAGVEPLASVIPILGRRAKQLHRQGVTLPDLEAAAAHIGEHGGTSLDNAIDRLRRRPNGKVSLNPGRRERLAAAINAAKDPAS